MQHLAAGLVAATVSGWLLLLVVEHDLFCSAVVVAVLLFKGRIMLRSCYVQACGCDFALVGVPAGQVAFE
jgi:hypothetical protein